MFKANDLDDCIEYFRVDLALVYQMAWFRDRNWSLSDLLMLKFPALDGQDINLPTYIYIFFISSLWTISDMEWKLIVLLGSFNLSQAHTYNLSIGVEMCGSCSLM